MKQPTLKSRRGFLKHGSIALGAAVLCELTGGSVLTGASRAIAAQKTEDAGMPHVNVQLWPGRSEEDKQRLADAIVEDVVRYTGASPRSVSVSIEEVDSARWKDEVYDPLLRKDPKTVYKKPGYSM